MRNHPYKRPQLHRVLTSLISNSSYKEIDATTRRLVERNLKASWADGITIYSPLPSSNKNTSGNAGTTIEGRNTKGSEEESIRGWSSGMGGRRGTTASNTSIHSNHSTHSNRSNSEDVLSNINTGGTGESVILASDISERIKELRLGSIGESASNGSNDGNNNGGTRSVGISREGSTDSVDQIASTDDHGTGRRKSMRLLNREAGEIEGHPIINLPGSSGSYTQIQTEYYSTLPRSSSPLSFPPSSSSSPTTSSPKLRNSSLPLPTSSYHLTNNDSTSLLLPPIAEINRKRSTSLLSPITQRLIIMEDIIERPNSSFDSSSTSNSPTNQEPQVPDSPSVGGSNGSGQKQQRRKAPPPPPAGESISRARTPSIISVASSITSNHSNHSNHSDSGSILERVGEGKTLPCLPTEREKEKRRAAPEPPMGGRRSSRNSVR